MPAWATVTIAALGVAGTLAGTLGGYWLQAKLARREREDAERVRWRERGAATLARVRSLLGEADPLRWGLSSSDEEFRTRWHEIWPRWSDIREQLDVLAAAHPSDEIGPTVEEIIDTVPKAILSGASLRSLTTGADGFDEILESAKSQHEDALALVERLRIGLRGGHAGATGPTETDRDATAIEEADSAD
jgi:hypothetical protein